MGQTSKAKRPIKLFIKLILQVTFSTAISNVFLETALKKLELTDEQNDVVKFAWETILLIVLLMCICLWRPVLACNKS